MLAAGCSRCGTANEHSAKFCGECGSKLGDQEATETADESSGRSPGGTERRLVSVLFVDLVGFTPYTERRDAEEVLAMLERYFTEARTLVGRYGGTIEKFIGDAIVAVWGFPIAQEDDAERAVRTALDLVAAVSTLGAELGVPDLRARAGVLTGEAAVGVDADAAGMGSLVGDIVNTAARIQSVAAPGEVFVGASTRMATEAAIAYEDEGTFTLKGKSEEVPLWRASRVVAARGGAMRSFGLEAPFSGRDRELRLVKELFHSAAERGRIQMVNVSGDAGSGKSRLVWEFEKYLDGLADTVLWHLGRCPAYGEGVAHWALADMVRGRARIAESDSAAVASAKLREVVATYVADPEDRRLLESRLGQLIGLESGAGRKPEDLFGAWRLFFEAMARQRPTVMVFEDLQWADASLIAFIDHLLEWSGEYALFVVVLTRPEAADRHPSLTVARRSVTPIYLEPLPSPAMEMILDGLAPGLPAELREQILDHAEGVPLYAVETVRMLVNRGALVLEGSTYRLQHDVESLEIPDSLQSLVSARLDGLTPDERAMVRDAAVLGKAFTKAGLIALGTADELLDALLASLVRKEIIMFQSEERSPEHGQYVFLQELVRRVAYETLSFADRKMRHLVAADHLERVTESGSYELVELVASHLLDACNAAPDADDAPMIRARAVNVLERSGQRAASLGAHQEAQLRFDQASELAEDPHRKAALLLASAVAANAAGNSDAATERSESARNLADQIGDATTSARAMAVQGEALMREDKQPQAVRLLEEAAAQLSQSDAGEAWATVAASLARVSLFSAAIDIPRTLELVNAALEIAESLQLHDIFAEALITKANAIMSSGRHEEPKALMRHALEFAKRHDLVTSGLRAQFNLVEYLMTGDDPQEGAAVGLMGLSMARRVGNRHYERLIAENVIVCLTELGRWDEAVELLLQQRTGRLTGLAWESCGCIARIHLARGDKESAKRLLSSMEHIAADDPQLQVAELVFRGRLCLGEGDPAAAIAHAMDAVEYRHTIGVRRNGMDLAYSLAMEAARAAGRKDVLDELLAQCDARNPGDRSARLTANVARFKAWQAAERGDATRADALFVEAEAAFRLIPAVYDLAVTLVEHAEWLVTNDAVDDAGPIADEARRILEDLQARPMLDRLNHVMPTSKALAEHA